MIFRLLAVLFISFSSTLKAQFTPIFGRDTVIEITKRQETFFVKGKQQLYDTNSRLFAEGKLLLRKRHGRWKFYDLLNNKSIVQYRFGEVRKELKTTKGKKVKLLLGYGKPMYFSTCQDAIDKYGVKRTMVAGCVVNNKILYRVNVHNVFLYLRKSLHYGFRWQEKMTASCREARKKITPQ
jgi:hypothetical protein